VLHLILFHADLNTKQITPAHSVDLWFKALVPLNFFKDFPAVRDTSNPNPACLY
jgi:hypothetical protein